MSNNGRSFLAAQVRRAEALGHKLELQPRGQMTRAVCSCGYESTNKRTAALALGSGIHHAGQVVAEAPRNGDTPDRTNVQPPARTAL